MTSKLQTLEAKLGYHFSNQDLLLEALSHPSAKKNLQRDYERLEFLGDRILNFIIAEALFFQYPNSSEGELSKRQNFLVCGETISEIAKKIELPEFMLLLETDKALGFKAIDAMEAVIAAVYLDSSYNVVRSVVLGLWQDVLQSENVHLDYDKKSMLQELIQAQGNFRPHYSTLKVQGSDHQPCFESKVTLPNGEIAVGRGNSKKSAEKEAALMALQIFQNKDNLIK
jgi:ribonuclease-3